jgi:hypothetical protein
VDQPSQSRSTRKGRRDHQRSRAPTSSGTQPFELLISIPMFTKIKLSDKHLSLMAPICSRFPGMSNYADALTGLLAEQSSAASFDPRLLRPGEASQLCPVMRTSIATCSANLYRVGRCFHSRHHRDRVDNAHGEFRSGVGRLGLRERVRSDDCPFCRSAIVTNGRWLPQWAKCASRANHGDRGQLVAATRLNIWVYYFMCHS